jgi:hypothetical protein
MANPNVAAVQACFARHSKQEKLKNCADFGFTSYSH